MNKQQLLAISLLPALLLLPGCAKYKAKALNRLNSGHISRKQEESVSFEYRIFTKEDSVRYLDRNVIKYGFQPVQITLDNNSDHTFSFSLSQFSFPCIPSEEVAECVHTNTAKRAAGYGVAGLFMPIFFIPAVVDGIGSSNANQKLDLDFARKSLEDQIIRPYSTINGLIFVPIKYFMPEFAFTLVDMKHDRQVKLETRNSHIKL